MIATLLALLGGLSANVMSGDIWALSVLHARQQALGYGVSEEAFATIMARVLDAQEVNRRRNPMASMF